jgi:hypothetical protein
LKGLPFGNSSFRSQGMKNQSKTLIKDLNLSNSVPNTLYGDALSVNEGRLFQLQKKNLAFDFNADTTQ